MSEQVSFHIRYQPRNQVSLSTPYGWHSTETQQLAWSGCRCRRTIFACSHPEWHFQRHVSSKGRHCAEGNSPRQEVGLEKPSRVQAIMLRGALFLASLSGDILPTFSLNLAACIMSKSEFFFYCAFYEAAFCSLPVAPTYPHGIINNNTREERRRLFILPFLHPFLHHHPNAFLRQDANVKTLLETSRAAFSHTAEVQ